MLRLPMIAPATAMALPEAVVIIIVITIPSKGGRAAETI